MPHLIIETSQNLSIPDPERLMQQIHQALFATGQVKALNDLKSRLYQSKHSLVATVAQLSILSWCNYT